MRPATLAQAFERIAAGVPLEQALPEFLDTFYLAPNADGRLQAIADPPAKTGQPRLDALAGAVAHYLAHHYALSEIPGWAFDQSRFLDRPWHTSPIDSDAIREYLTFASPAEFSSRNIFTDERPLLRARTPA